LWGLPIVGKPTLPLRRPDLLKPTPTSLSSARVSEQVKE
jgi:hypothetical protein